MGFNYAGSNYPGFYMHSYTGGADSGSNALTSPKFGNLSLTGGAGTYDFSSPGGGTRDSNAPPSYANLGDFADIVVTSLNKSKWLDRKGGGYIWTDKKLNLDLSTDNMLDWNIETKCKNRTNRAKELLNAGLDLIGKDIPNSWLRGMYFTGTPTRRPYIPLHELYGKFDCPIIDSYSNKIDWVSIFD